MKLLAPSRVAPPYVADIIRQPRLVLLPAPPPTPATLPQHRHPTHSARHDAPTHTCAPHHALAHPLARPPIAPTQTRCSPPAARRCCGAAAARLAPLLTTARTAALCRTPSLLFLSRSRAVSPWAWVVAHDRLRRSTGWLAAPLPRSPRSPAHHTPPAPPAEGGRSRTVLPEELSWMAQSVIWWGPVRREGVRKEKKGLSRVCDASAFEIVFTSSSGTNLSPWIESWMAALACP